MIITDAHLKPGVLLYNGDYRIEEKIGKGGFGITYRATMPRLGKTVVLKEMFFDGYCVRNKGESTISIQSLDQDEYTEIKARFIQEGKTLARFSHNNIVRIQTLFEENNTVYLVIDFIDGESLQERIQKRGKMSPKEVLAISRQIMKALKVVHTKNVLHRDIKPANVMIEQNGHVTLIDFGIARQFTADKTLTVTKALTQGYAPLEQYGGQQNLGPFTDIYALSGTIYFMLTGKRPPDATDRALEDTLIPPINLNTAVKSSINAMILKGMSIRSADRFQNIAEMEKATKPKITIRRSYTSPPILPRTETTQRASSPTTHITRKKPATSKPTIISKPPPTVVTLRNKNKNTTPNDDRIQPAQRPPRTPQPTNTGSNFGVLGTSLSKESIIYATFGQRLGAYIIDAIIIWVGATLSVALLIGADIIYGEGEAGLVGIILYWLYFSISESSQKQATFGKVIVGLKVTGLNGDKISFAKASGRFFGKIISGVILLIGYLMPLWTVKKQALHDLMADTLVVQTRK